MSVSIWHKPLTLVYAKAQSQPCHQGFQQHIKQVERNNKNRKKAAKKEMNKTALNADFGVKGEKQFLLVHVVE